MRTAKLFAILVTAALLLSLLGSVAAAPPTDNPGKGSPELDKIVFVHYGKDFAPAKPAGTPGKGPGGEKELYSYSRIHWAHDDIPVGYSINLTGSCVAGDNATAGIEAAFQTWENVTGSYMSFNCSGTTASSPGINADKPDYENVVGWANITAEYPSAIAVTVVWYLRGKKLIVDCDTALNTDSVFAWTQASIATDSNETLLTDTADYDVDVQNIMTHEAGHWLMLDDLYADVASQQTMYYMANDCELKKRSLESGDIAGIQKIYPVEKTHLGKKG